MRIDATRSPDLLEGEGVTSVAHTPLFARGLRSGAREYQGFDASGRYRGNPDITSSWAELGPAPKEALLLLTQDSLRILARDAEGMRVWGTWPRGGVGGDTLSIFPLDDAPLGPPGAFGASVEGERVYACASGALVQSGKSLTHVDFATDTLRVLDPSGITRSREEGGVLFSSLPGGIDAFFLPPDATYRLPDSLIRDVAVWRLGTLERVALVYADTVWLLERDLAVPASEFLPLWALDEALGVSWSSAEFYARTGDLFLAGSSSAGCVWSAVWRDGRAGPGAVRLFPGLAATAPRIRLSAEGLYLLLDDSVALLRGTPSSFTVGTPATLLASRRDLDVGVDTRAIMDPPVVGGRYVDLVVDGPYALVLLREPGSSLLTAYDKYLHRALWRRGYGEEVPHLALGWSPFVLSSLIYPGRTASLPPGFGPDDVEAS